MRNLRPYVAAVVHAADCLILRSYSGEAQLSRLRLAVADLASQCGIPVFPIPHNPPPRPIERARGDWHRALMQWCDDADSLPLYLAQDRARVAFERACGRAHEHKRARTMSDARAPVPVRYVTHAPQQALLDLTRGSAAMAGHDTREARELSMRQARAVSVLAAHRGKQHFKTRRSIADLINEVQSLVHHELDAILA